MGLQDALGFTFQPPNIAQRGMQRVGSSTAGAWVFQRTLYRIDRPLHRWSDGRLTVPGVLTGLPVIMLTTTGAKSGLERTMPVAGIPYASDLVVLGTNYAQVPTPGWVFNLLAHPQATVAWKSSTCRVVARRVPPEEMEAVWLASEAVYSGFPKYRDRLAESRSVTAFVLEPAE
ncbi:MAG: nitroreductase family deazaflavin-dependent oxidoreductase [Actinobacteria bacterium]|uniref:Unannotated protein n=1 Tax=freshwater metagenome TaxID=449393 RepID=A0A6J7KQ56_9ZZZZ|nr:nitroreductase family deazaflavin-dependent oxidoreductase [Actinomycetota bacterium]